ncbi:hypothetical protein CC1G_15456 [Coprinopsis cinerea okayama7|uniref:Uncharacterized protein n=1 Tax=Coprinopsis cinerea (strain Okayama-7 / 130 / ATCC MYA-4618 / FGSC 9003) TaxID=240176 RepID=D6RQP8_COPC7|nr:hypothetical protein CC1G_15456 [Coprinopsis cinerea okayama7\|eukprot:XP_002910179.1 hypothetical protein CC1G_15456 [Coprinopsis cinerea okayama7\
MFVGTSDFNNTILEEQNLRPGIKAAIVLFYITRHWGRVIVIGLKNCTISRHVDSRFWAAMTQCKAIH